MGLSELKNHFTALWDLFQKAKTPVPDPCVHQLETQHNSKQVPRVWEPADFHSNSTKMSQLHKEMSCWVNKGCLQGEYETRGETEKGKE